MLKFTETAKNAQLLAIYYANKLKDEFVIDFMSSRISISSPEEAERVTKIFWKMVDLAIEDNEKEVSIEGVNDIEFWMHKLFNKISGYMTLNGFEEQWDKATKEAKEK